MAVTVSIPELLDGKWEDGRRPKDLYKNHISAQPEEYLPALIEGLQGTHRKVQSGCAELASLLSEEHPELLYPHVSLFLANLDAKAPVLRWEAACTLGNLARVDTHELLPAALPRLVPMLANKSIVLQGHAVRSLARIAGAHPASARAAFEAMRAAQSHFPKNRIGFVIEAMVHFSGNASLLPDVRAFVSGYLASDIAVVAKKAGKTMKALK